MLFDPLCFIKYVEENGEAIIEYIDNWADGQMPTYYFFGDLVINMNTFFHINYQISKKIISWH